MVDKWDNGAIPATLNDYKYDTKSNGLTGEILLCDDLCTTHTYYSKAFSEPITTASVGSITTANYSCDCTSISTAATSISIEPETIETGRIDEGSHSNQEFQDSDNL